MMALESRLGFPRLGTCITSDGSSFAGQMCGALPDGFGIGASKQGDKYAGQWRKSNRDGWGCVEYATKGAYHGSFRSNVMDGTGVYTWADGSMYKGQFQAGLWHGSALFVTKTGTKWFVSYEKGKRVANVPFSGTEAQLLIMKKAEEARVRRRPPHIRLRLLRVSRQD